MYVAEYIDPSFEALSPANTAREARLIMEAQDVEVLPVVGDDGNYITMLSLEDEYSFIEDKIYEVLKKYKLSPTQYEKVYHPYPVKQID